MVAAPPGVAELSRASRFRRGTSVSVSRWSPRDGSRSRWLGVVRAVDGDCVLVEALSGGAGSQWRFASDLCACETVADDGSIALCRGGLDLLRCGAYEALPDLWRRTVLVRGVEVHALEDVPDDPESTDGPRTLWPAAVAAARLLEGVADQIRGASFVELGAGSGLPSVAAVVLGAAAVVATEQPNAVAFLEWNCLANAHLGAPKAVNVEALDWFAPATIPPGLAPRVVLASDCTYNVQLHDALLGTIAALLARTPPDGGKAFALVVSDEASTPNAGRTLRAFVDAARARFALDADEVDPVHAHEGNNAPPPHWRTRTPPTVRAFRLELRRV